MMEGIVEYAAATRGITNHAAGTGSGASLSPTLAGHPFLLADHLHASKADRERWAELLFERFDCPGIFISKAGVLSVYANARTSGLSVDVGYSGTYVLPVQAGYPLLMGACSVRRSNGVAVATSLARAPLASPLPPAGARMHPVGGRALDAYVARAIGANPSLVSTATHAALASSATGGAGAGAGAAGSASTTASLGGASALAGLPYYMRNLLRAFPAGTHPSFLRHQITEVARECKETVCRVNSTATKMAATAALTGGVPTDAFGAPISMGPTTTIYELPDGSPLDLGLAAHQVPETLWFHPNKPAQLPPATSTTSSSSTMLMTDAATIAAIAADFPGIVPLTTTIGSAAAACDLDVRRELCASVVVTGGSASMYGFVERLGEDLDAEMAAGQRWRVVGGPAPAAERQLGPWLGGSIIASMGSYPDLWLSKAEYQEAGAAMVHRKCP